MSPTPYRAAPPLAAASPELVVAGDAWLPPLCLKCACRAPLVSRPVRIAKDRTFVIPLCPRCDERREHVRKASVFVAAIVAIGLLGVPFSGDPGGVGGGTAIVAGVFAVVFWTKLRFWMLRVRALPGGAVGLRDVHPEAAHAIGSLLARG